MPSEFIRATWTKDWRRDFVEDTRRNFGKYLRSAIYEETDGSAWEKTDGATWEKTNNATYEQTGGANCDKNCGRDKKYFCGIMKSNIKTVCGTASAEWFFENTDSTIQENTDIANKKILTMQFQPTARLQKSV